MESAHRCYLLELPAELRVRIYDYVYDESYTMHITIDSERVYRWNRPVGFGGHECKPDSQRAALLRTCRLLYKEARPVLYEATSAEIDAYPGEDAAVFVKDTVAGLLNECTFLRHIAHIGELCIYQSSRLVDPGAMAARLMELTTIWTSENPPTVAHIEINLVSDFEKAAGPIFEALLSLDCQPESEQGFSAVQITDISDDRVSFEILAKFYEQYGSVARHFSPR